MHRYIHALTFTFIFIGACGGKNDSDTEASDSTAGATGTDTTAGTDATDATGTVGMSSTPTTSGDDGSGSANPTQDNGTMPGDTAGGMTTTGNNTTTGGDPDLMQLCEAWCNKNVGCQETGRDACAAECFADLSDQEGMCADAFTALLECMLGMTCEEFVAFTDEDEPGPCAAEADAYQNACSDEVCIASIGTNQDNTECSYSVDCPGEPSRELQCADETCICLEDGEQVGMCPAMNACMNIDELSNKALDCCDFI